MKQKKLSEVLTKKEIIDNYNGTADENEGWDESLQAIKLVAIGCAAFIVIVATVIMLGWN